VLDGDELELGTDPTEEDDACAESESAATLTKQPIDLILVVDTSGSMDDEIDAIQENLNVRLAEELEAEELDYRVILLGEYPGMIGGGAPPPGASGSDKLDICISTPLGGAVCTCTLGSNCVDGNGDPITGPPVMTDKFKHYDVLVDSHDGLRRIVNDYDEPDEQDNPGWGSYLREGAQRVFILISDDDEDAVGSITNFEDFHMQLISVDPSFGTMDTPAYKFHAILGLAARAMPDQDLPWLATDPIVGTECTPDEADDEGSNIQSVAIGSGGLRFPICAEDDFGAIFNVIADDVIEGSALDCEFTPTPPSNGTLDFSKMVVYFTAGGATSPTKFTRVDDIDDCDDDSYYVDEGLGTVTICQTACDAIQADPAGQLAVHVACNGPGGVN
jgi:hypothetical protein